MVNLPLLSTLIWLPIIAGIIILLFRKKLSTANLQGFALAIVLASLGLCIKLYSQFDTETWQMQFTETFNWVPNLNIYYRLGIDGFALPLIILTVFINLLVIIASFRSVHIKVPDYLATFLILQGLMCGVFSALDAILFYTFWEAMLVPMFLIIGIWGGPNRIYATLKFFLYTFLGSVLLLVAIIYLQLKAIDVGSIAQSEVFNILTFHQLPLTLATQKWIFFALLIAFAVKIPMWPVHTWLPDAHVEAPTGGSVILAAILLKMGGYGFIRFLLPITPEASQAFAGGIIGLSMIAIIYIGLVAIVQKDMKTLIAYSSISHMGFVTLGFFIIFFIINHSGDTNLAAMGIEGGMVQMISHGFVSGALFLCVGVLYDRMHSRLINDYGGVVNTMPIFAAFFMLFSLANVGLPGTSGFVGEFLVILSAFKANMWIAFAAASILILGASYTLWMYKRVVLGPVRHEAVSGLFDLHLSEKLMFAILAFAVIGLGLYPKPLLSMLQAPSQHLVDQILRNR